MQQAGTSRCLSPTAAISKPTKTLDRQLEPTQPVNRAKICSIINLISIMVVPRDLSPSGANRT